MESRANRTVSVVRSVPIAGLITTPQFTANAVPFSLLEGFPVSPGLESGQRRVDVVEFLELAAILGFDAAKALKEIAAGDDNA
jgi:hypothetical protein